ncbi:hypothetical protein EMCRGX_G013017 [Ephydatia muelleri]
MTPTNPQGQSKIYMKIGLLTLWRSYSHSPIPQLEQDVGMGHLSPPLPPKLEILDLSLKLNVLSCQDQLNRMPLQ